MNPRGVSMIDPTIVGGNGVENRARVMERLHHLAPWVGFWCCLHIFVTPRLFFFGAGLVVLTAVESVSWEI